jgi:hypothetical protein|tara:strand:- start:131 stop:388 length:258 start_codon:yes stop_codon:yes gene_type:complete
MNYKSELRGFALDRAIKLNEGQNKDLAAIRTDADSIVDYLYIAEKDIESHVKTLVDLIGQGREMDKLKAFIVELQQILAEMEAGV